MIESRITSKAQTTVPKAVRVALGVKEGDRLAYEIDGDRVTLRRLEAAGEEFDPFVNNFSTFTEWASEADCEAFDHL